MSIPAYNDTIVQRNNDDLSVLDDLVFDNLETLHITIGTIETQINMSSKNNLRELYIKYSKYAANNNQSLFAFSSFNSLETLIIEGPTRNAQNTAKGYNRIFGKSVNADRTDGATFAAKNLKSLIIIPTDSNVPITADTSSYYVDLIDGTGIAYGVGFVYVPDSMVDEIRTTSSSYAFFNEYARKWLIQPLSRYPILTTPYYSETELLTAIQNGTFHQTYSIGDVFHFTSTIKDFNAEYIGDRDEGPVFLTLNGYERMRMLSSTSSGVSYSYAGTLIDSYLTNDFYDALSANVKQAIAEVDLVTRNNTEEETLRRKVFLLSARELCFTGSEVETSGIQFSSRFNTTKRSCWTRYVDRSVIETYNAPVSSDYFCVLTRTMSTNTGRVVNYYARIGTNTVPSLGTQSLGESGIIFPAFCISSNNS